MSEKGFIRQGKRRLRNGTKEQRSRPMTDNQKPVNCGCGGEAFTHILGNEIAKGYYIACDECGTKTKVFGYEAEAITAWNRAMSGSAEEKLKAFWDGMSAEMKEERTAKVEAGMRVYEDCSECSAENCMPIVRIMDRERTAKVYKKQATDRLYQFYCGECCQMIDCSFYEDYKSIKSYCPYCGCRLEWE